MSGERKPSDQKWEGAGPAGTAPVGGSTKIERKQLLILLVLSLSLAIIVIDATIVIVAQYQIQKDFGISLKDLEWITSLYALVFGSFLLTWGKLSDEFGRKRIFVAGISLFIIGSIVDGFSQGLSQILVGRIMQGFGAAMASPSTLSILTTTFTGKARNVAFGIWGATAGAAAVLGPVLGGYFTSDPTLTWRWAFFINIPIGITALVGAAFAIKETRFKDPKYTTDYPGPVFIFAPVAGILATRFGPKWVVTTGMALEAIALFSLSQIISVENPVYYMYPILVIYGAGVGLAISQLTSTVLQSIPWQKAGVGSGANNTVRQIGSAFGIAVIGAVLVAQISTVGVADLATSTASFSVQQRVALTAALNSGLSGGIDPSFLALFGGNVPAVLSILYDAITQGARWAAFTAGIFVSLGAISSLLIPNPKSAQTAKTTIAAKASRRGASRAVTAIVIAQFAITIVLLVAISNEYKSNYFMQQWISQNASPLGYFLTGYVGPALAMIVGGVLIVWKLVLIRRGSEAKSEPTS